MKYTYFPGCSLKGLGRAYEESFRSVTGNLAFVRTCVILLNLLVTL